MTRSVVKVLGVEVAEAAPAPAPEPPEESSPDTHPGFASPHGGVESEAVPRQLARELPAPPTAPVALRGVELAVVRAPTAAQEPETTTTGSVEVLVHHELPPVTGGVPLLTARDSPEAEDYRVLRQRLQLGATPGHVLAVAAPTEAGLSSEIALNLALALGEHSTEPVLLIEANFATPALSTMLGVPPPECFAAQMRGVLHLASDEKRWVAMSVGYEHVHLLVIDPLSDPATRRFDPPAFRAALSALKRSPYAQIIVDLPPPLRSSGFNLAGDLVDGALLGVLARNTRARHIKLAAERLAPVPVLGTVVLR